MGKLVILRGPSGAGKSTVAKALFEQVKEPAVLIGQDYYRFIFKPPGGAVNSKSIHKMIKANTLIALKDNYNVVLEGIFTAESYKSIFDEIFDIHKADNYIFTFDISFEETIRRHLTKPNKDEWSETDMKSWYPSSDLVGYDFEQVITEKYSIKESVEKIRSITEL